MPVKLKSKREFNEKKTIMGSYSGRSEKKKFICKSKILISEVEETKSKRKSTGKIIVEEQLVSCDIELGAFIKECRNSNDGQYVVVTMLIFEMAEPVERSFVFNRKTFAIKHLIQMANKFKDFRESKDIADLMGKAAIVIISENKGFDTVKVCKEISIEELDEMIALLEDIDDETEDDSEEDVYE